MLGGCGTTLSKNICGPPLGACCEITTRSGCETRTRRGCGFASRIISGFGTRKKSWPPTKDPQRGNTQHRTLRLSHNLALVKRHDGDAGWRDDAVYCSSFATPQDRVPPEAAVNLRFSEGFSGFESVSLRNRWFSLGFLGLIMFSVGSPVVFLRSSSGFPEVFLKFLSSFISFL